MTIDPDELRNAARNVENARKYGTTGHLAGWEHIAIREAATALDERAALTARVEALEGENARLLGVLNKIANMRPVMEVSGQFPDLSTLPCQQLARQALENSSHA